MNSKSINPFFYFLILIFTFLAISCSDNNTKIIKQDERFTEYISAFTSGVISNQSNIIIELKEDLSNDDISKIDASQLFDFSPKIEGEVSWINNRTVSFIPKTDLKTLQLYNAKFHLSKLYVVPSDMLDFEFQFQTKRMDLNIFIEGMGAYNDDLNWQKISGVLTTSDNVSIEMIKQLVVAKQKTKTLQIRWENLGDSYRFVIDSVVRSETSGMVDILWDGKLIGVNKKGEINYKIPPLGDFKVMSATVSQQPNQYILVRFSDPLDKNEDLSGLVYFESNEELTMSINKNELTIYPSSKLIGNKVLKISNSLKNAQGFELIEPIDFNANFISIKPQVELIGDGVILPSTNGLIFPFKAVNLNAVNVKVIRIYEDNVAHFFQENNFDGTRALTRVGRIVFKDDIELKSSKKIDYSNWNTFSLDLSKMIETEPGAIYRVLISFKMSQSLYPCDCDNNKDAEKELDFEDSFFDDTKTYWYSSNNYNYSSRYSWTERDDPCKLSYYLKSNNNAGRNVFASNLGIMAKGGDNGKIMAVVSNLKTTNPESGVKVELYNLQNRLLSSKTTNSEGIVYFNLDKKPFLLTAKKGKEVGYLKLDDGSALSMSMFDVEGTKSQDGLKGFIYTDRGVWRPGDSLFISFILENNNILPKNHPVVFTLYNALGQLHHRIIKTDHENGFYVFKTKTNTDDETGNWKAQIKVGDSYFSKKLKIETIKPNRLKVNLDFGSKILSNNENKPINLASNWLHGAPAKNLKVDVEISLSESTTRFEMFKGYNFDDQVKEFRSQDIKVAQKKLDNNGELVFTPNFKVNNTDAPGILKASFKTRVFEKGGDVSTDRVLMPYSPYRSYIGIKMPKGEGWSGALYSDKKNLLPIATVDEFGNPIDRKDVKIEIFRIKWRWWWESNNIYDIGRYVTGSFRDLIHSDKVDTKDGKAIYELDLNKDIWDRCYVRITDPISGHSCGEVFYMTYSGYWSTSKTSDGAEMLSFNTDKKKYNVGENILVTLPKAKKGRALISVEKGSEVLNTFWINVSEGKNTFEIKSTANMAPNVFLNVSFIQPHKHTENDLPIRLYGVRGIAVEDPKTHLSPIISMPDELQPKENVTIKVSEQNGKKMTYTIAVVDDGLLDLTHFKTPNAWKTFFAWQALEVKTWDMYKFVSGAFTGKMAGLLEIGGDIYAKNSEKKNANRFKPVVKFLGPFTLQTGKTAKHTFKMPNYIGSVRTMVVAGNNGTYGSSEKTTAVKKPLMVLASLPRVLGPFEEVELPVTVFAMIENIKNVSVKIETNDFIDIVGDNNKNINFNQIGDKVVNFRLKVKNDLGIGRVRVVCTSGSEIAIYDIELNVRMPNPEISNVLSSIIKAGEKWETPYKAFGINGTNTGVLELSSVPPINLDSRLKYLIQYPHGCIEQTTSSVFPQLFLSDLVNLTSTKKREVQKNITDGLNRLKSFQISNGGFTYWPNSGYDADMWGTNYAGHFMIEAKNKGYSLPIGLFDNWTKYQTNTANNWNNSTGGSTYYRRSSQLIQAYRLYTLALAQKPALSAMNKMRNCSNLSVIAKWKLAAAYHIIGRTSVANNLVYGYKSNIESYKESSYTYGSKERDEAMILQVMALLGEYEAGKEIMDRMASKLSSSEYMSTHTTAYVLLAISKYIGGNSNSKGFSFDYTINSVSNKVKTESFFKQIDVNVDQENNGNISVSNTTDKMLFANLQLRGIPIYDGNVIKEESNLKMEVKYFSMEDVEIDPSTITQGTDFYEEITLTHPGLKSDYENLALTQIFPSGWEIRNSRMDLLHSAKKDVFTYQDIRDDRVYTYFNLKKGETKVLKIQLNASFLGRYYLPIANCEAMYDHTVNAKNGGSWVEVVKSSVE